MPTKITLEEIEAHLEERAKYNALDLNDVEFSIAGKSVPITAEAIKHHKFTGLNVLDFFQFGYWKPAVIEEIESLDPDNMVVCEICGDMTVLAQECENCYYDDLCPKCLAEHIARHALTATAE